MTIRKLVPGQAGLPVPSPSDSYWLRQPEPALLGHHTTEELPKEVDVVVVGSGITGAFAARFLLEGQKEVLLLEAREACWGATGRNGGHCQPIVFAGPDHIAAFEIANWAFVRGLIRDEDIPCDWANHPGVRVFLTKDVFAAAAARAEGMKKSFPGLAGDIEIVYPENQERLKELKVPDVEGVIVQPRAASLWPYKLVASILTRLVRRFSPDQFNLQTNTPVTNLRPISSSGPGGLRWRVTTPRGTVSARQVLLATNAYTSRLLPDVADLIVPVRGQVSALKPPRGSARLGMSFGFDQDGGDNNRGGGWWRNDYLIQRPGEEGVLIFGGGRVLEKGMGVGEWRDDEVEEDVAKFLRTQLAPPVDFGPSSGDLRTSQTLEAVAEWTGIMGYSRDHVPWIGPIPESLGGGEGLFLCAGYSGHGMPNTSLSAHAVVEMMRGVYPGGGVMDYKLPEEYVITEERISRARKEIEVQGWGELGCVVDYPELLEMRRAKAQNLDGSP